MKSARTQPPLAAARIMAGMALAILCWFWTMPAAADGTPGNCARCHPKESADFPSAAGKHKDFECGDCHAGHPPEVPKPYPVCTDCHTSHSQDMTPADCGKCHRAHAPGTVAWDATVASGFCRGCHSAAFDELAAGSPKHRAIPCAVCHREKHKAIPVCGDCHGRLHPAPIMARFPTCGACHHTAHALNHWPEKPTGGATSAPK